jgi:hypothetical protein
MYAQRPTTSSTQPIRKISPKSIAGSISNPPCTPENWQHLVSIVMKLVQDKQIKDSVITDLATRMTNLETSMDHGMSFYFSSVCANFCVVPISDTFTLNSVPAFLRGRLRRSYALVSKQLHARTTRRSSYRLTFHQYLGVPGLGIGVSRGNGAYRPHHAEQILFLSASALETLADSIAGEKERKLPDILLKYLQLEKREFVRDWMRGYINLEKDEEEFAFSVDSERCDNKEIWIEFVGLFDGMGRVVGENKLSGCAKTCREKAHIDVSVSRVDLVV